MSDGLDMFFFLGAVIFVMAVSGTIGYRHGTEDGYTQALHDLTPHPPHVLDVDTRTLVQGVQQVQLLTPDDVAQRAEARNDAKMRARREADALIRRVRASYPDKDAG